MLVSLKTMPDEAIKSITPIKLDPSVHILKFCDKTESTHKVLLHIEIRWFTSTNVLKKSAYVLELQAELLFSWKAIFTWKNDVKTMAVSRWVFGRCFLENELSKPITLKKTADIIRCQWWKLNFQTKLRILVNLSPWAL